MAEDGRRSMRGTATDRSSSVDKEISVLIDDYEGVTGPFDAALRRIPADRMREPWLGGWSAHEIVCHLADSESVGLYRIRLAAAEPGSVIHGYDEAAWAAAWPYAQASIESAAAVFRSLRGYNASLLRALPAEAWERTVIHDRAGAWTLRRTLEVYVGHGKLHLDDLAAIADAPAPAS